MEDNVVAMCCNDCSAVAETTNLSVSSCFPLPIPWWSSLLGKKIMPRPKRWNPLIPGYLPITCRQAGRLISCRATS